MAHQLAVVPRVGRDQGEVQHRGRGLLRGRVAQLHHVRERMWQATAESVLPDGGGATVRVTGAHGAGEVRARHVVLAPGEERTPAPAG